MAEGALKIAIDGRELAGKPTGVGRYVLEILRAWQAAGLPHRVTVITPAEPDSNATAELSSILWHVEPAERFGTRWEQMTLPRLLADARPDVFFAPAYTAPLRLPCPMVVVIHDVSFFAHPEWFGRREGWRRRWLTRATSRRARTVVTVSDFARSEILKYLPVRKERIVLAPPGTPALVNETDRGREPLLLFVGSLFNRRHIVELIQAFAIASKRVQGARLVMVGDNRTNPPLDPRAIAGAAGVGHLVDWREYASDEVRDDLYRSARGFVFLSDYEGFGIPPFEALANGVAPIVLDTPVSREIYGEGAVRVGLDTSAIADAIIQVLTDDGLRSRVIAAGRSRLAEFSWRDTAATIRRVLEQAAGDGVQGAPPIKR